MTIRLRNKFLNGFAADEFRAAQEHFSEVELANLSAAIALVNAWNRIAKPYQFTPVPVQ